MVYLPIVARVLGGSTFSLDSLRDVPRIRRSASSAEIAISQKPENQLYEANEALALIPEDKIAEIRDRTDIVQVVGEYVQLRRAGVNHKGLCPFHQEKNPSFNVSAEKRFYHCFGCGKSGDVFSFLCELEGKRFVDVARELAKRAGVELPEARSMREQELDRERESERAKLIRLHELAANFYCAQLAAPDGERALAYVRGRGIEAAIAEQFRVGYAPAGWDALTRHFADKRVPHELAERAGLIRRRAGDNGPRESLAPGAPPTSRSHFDVFVDRVVYALTSPMGEVIGFGGRILDGDAKVDAPKYKNSPETPIYKKGENLFGLHAAKHAMRRSGQALVVEGNFDVMTLHQHGLDMTVAPQGTAITPDQVRLLARFAKEVVLLLDADPAGRAATLKVVHLFVAEGLPARIVSLRGVPKPGAAPGTKTKVDPDDLARHDLPALQSLIANALDAVEFFFDQVAITASPTVPGKVAAIEECVPLLRGVRDPLARDLYIDRLSQLLKIDVGLVRRTLRAATAPASAAPPRMVSAVPAIDVELAPLPAVPVQQRPLPLSLGKLVAFLGQHATLVGRMTPERLAKVSDPAVRALVAQAAAIGRFDGAWALTHAAPEIRDAVAHALVSEEYRTTEAKVIDQLFEEITASIELSDDRVTLDSERRAALARGDLETVRRVSVRLRNLLRLQSQG